MSMRIAFSANLCRLATSPEAVSTAAFGLCSLGTNSARTAFQPRQIFEMVDVA
jgi:hypothetical protein